MKQVDDSAPQAFARVRTLQHNTIRAMQQGMPGSRRAGPAELARQHAERCRDLPLATESGTERRGVLTLSEDNRAAALRRQLPDDYELPLIDGYKLTNHAALRMVVRQIEIDWVRDALAATGRSTDVEGTTKHWGEMAMCVVNHSERTIVTVGYGRLNGGCE